MLNALAIQASRLCFDTCHAFASGYDLRTEAGGLARRSTSGTGWSGSTTWTRSTATTP